MSLKYALLGLLAESPKYGYELKRRFEGALGNVWSVSYGQLYPTLHRLSEMGWLTKKTEPGKKAAEKNIYSITEKGRRKLDEWLLKPMRSSYKVKDEFTLRFLFFGKLSPWQRAGLPGGSAEENDAPERNVPGDPFIAALRDRLLHAGHHPQGDHPPGS